MNKLTRQEVFTKVVQHLRTQNRKALSESGSCVYRAPNGDKCAAGCLIADEQYTTDLEGDNVNCQDTSYALFASGVSFEDIEMVCDLQIVHDNHEPAAWERDFKRIAWFYGLELPNTTEQV